MLGSSPLLSGLTLGESQVELSFVVFWTFVGPRELIDWPSVHEVQANEYCEFAEL